MSGCAIERDRHRFRAHGLLALSLALLSTLGACGFQLRGLEGGSGSALPVSWRSMHLNTNHPDSELSRAVETTFSANGVRWLTRDTANYRLQLGPEQFSQRNLSMNAQARPAEFDLVMRADFIVLDHRGQVAMPRTMASVNKQMENDPQNVVGKVEEVRMLRGELRGELARQILRRISFFAANAEDS